jgi:hypothetical protein
VAAGLLAAPIQAQALGLGGSAPATSVPATSAPAPATTSSLPLKTSALPVTTPTLPPVPTVPTVPTVPIKVPAPAPPVSTTPLEPVLPPAPKAPALKVTVESPKTPAPAPKVTVESPKVAAPAPVPIQAPRPVEASTPSKSSAGTPSASVRTPTATHAPAISPASGVRPGSAAISPARRGGSVGPVPWPKLAAGRRARAASLTSLSGTGGPAQGLLSGTSAGALAASLLRAGLAGGLGAFPIGYAQGAPDPRPLEQASGTSVLGVRLGPAARDSLIAALLIFGMGVLIFGLMFADGLGIGPRHEDWRRRFSQRWSRRLPIGGSLAWHHPRHAAQTASGKPRRRPPGI